MHATQQRPALQAFLPLLALRGDTQGRADRAEPAVVRRARPQDCLMAPAFLQGLSPRTHHRRFHGRLPALGAAALARPTTGDGRHQAMVATLRLGGREVLVGDARFVVEGDGRDAEFAIVVTDAMRRQGLGRALMLALAQAASDAGVRWLRGEVHDDNPAMLSLMISLGFAPTRRDVDAGIVVFEQRLR
jgi:acetyltransferase